MQDVTEEVMENISTVYKENSAKFIYFVILYNIFNEFLEDISEDVLPNEATGFKDSQIWNKLYDFQKDAALSIINKLETYNGCILADSVGLGKTYTALAVIKYYENRNKTILVLCPKTLGQLEYLQNESPEQPDCKRPAEIRCSLPYRPFAHQWIFKWYPSRPDKLGQL